MKVKIFPLFFIMMLILSSCSEISENTSESMQTASQRDIFAMDTFMNLKAYGENRENALSEAVDKITGLERTFSVTDEESEIWKINNSGGKAVSVSSDTSDIISRTLEICRKTNGILDITVYPVLREWGFTTGNYKIPEAPVLEKLLCSVDYRKVILENDTVKIPSDLLIDLGASAKGYTSDAVIEIFRKNGISSAIINLGGNVHALGTKPDGSEWKVSVADPFEESGQMCIVSVSDKAVITSGDYERYFIGDDGKKYFHIIDTSDGYPADNGLVSATVIGESGIMCDCLSTALFIMGKDKAYEYYKQYGGFDMILVSDDKKMYITEGIKDDLKNISSMECEVLHD